MTSVVSLQIDSNELTEQITKLFPKCRPRDLNLNPVHDDHLDNNIFMMDLDKEINRCENERDEGGQEEDDDDNGSPDNDSSSSEEDDFNNEEDLVIDHTCSGPEGQVIVLQSSKGATYKLRDSRIIEIAGGRELFSQSRSKAVRNKPRCNNDHVTDITEKIPVKNKSPVNKNIWESTTAPTPKKEENREITETVFSTEIHSVKHQRSSNPPVTLSYDAAVTNNLSKIRGGSEVVVFDDIGDGSSWRRRLEMERKGLDRGKESNGSSPSPPSYHQTPSDFFKVATSMHEMDGKLPQELETNKGPKVIGGLPIAEYEGSPRRYGPRHSETNQNTNHPLLPSAHSLLASPSVYPPRPGFPQRVVSQPSSTDQTPGSKQGSASTSPNQTTANSTFDYLYEFSETRKVLEEFFKQTDNVSSTHDFQVNEDFDELGYELRRQAGRGSAYVGLRLAKGVAQEQTNQGSPQKGSNSAGDNSNQCSREQDIGEHESNFLDLSADSASTEDLGDTEVGLQVGHSRNFTLSPETTDCDSNCGDLDSEVSLLLMETDLAEGQSIQGSNDQNEGSGLQIPDSLRIYSSMPILEDGLSSGHASDTDNNNPTVMLMKRQITEIEREIIQRQNRKSNQSHTMNGAPKMISDVISPVHKQTEKVLSDEPFMNNLKSNNAQSVARDGYENDPEIEALDPLNSSQVTPPPPAPAPHRSLSVDTHQQDSVEAAIKDIRLTLQRTKTLPLKSPTSEETNEITASPIWIPRRRTRDTTEYDSRKSRNGGDEGPEEEEADTDLETDRLLGQQRTDDHGFYDEKLEKEGGKKKGRNKEVLIHEPSVLIEGVLFRARYLGSTQLVCEGQPTKSTRMMQAEEAVSRIKAPEGETQPSTEVDLFISTEKIMVLNTDLKEIMMDHALRTISYIADIGDLVVLMARRRYVPHDVEEPPKINRTPKMICHVFESEEAQFIAQSIGQAFQVAYMEFLKANGIEDHSFVKEMDYQEVLNSQEIFGDELQMFAKKEMQKEVVVPKAKGEILGVVIVESGWGSMLPTVVIANLAPSGAAARCGLLNIGDQIIAINGVSLVGLPLSTCQSYIKNTKNQTVVKLTVVPCAPVVEVKIKRPDTKYQLGFSVQNGVICSLLRGGIAERGGVRVGHRIIEINNQSVVAVPHEKIVNLLATSVGEILMKTMPTSMFRLLTGQETPLYI